MPARPTDVAITARLESDLSRIGRARTDGASVEKRPWVGKERASVAAWWVARHTLAVKRARLVAAHTLIATIGLGSLACIVTGRDVWPFLSYPMYADLVEGRREQFWLYGESDAGEAPLHGYRYWQPADEQRLGTGLRQLADRPEGGALVSEALARLAARYEDARRAGRHDGPELDALRVYAVRWDVRSGQSTARAPDERVLIGEVRLDESR
jgi:hypothetical protein